MTHSLPKLVTSPALSLHPEKTLVTPISPKKLLFNMNISRTSEEADRELLLLSDTLDTSLGQIFKDSKNPLDTNSLPVVDYLNVIFPNGKLLSISLS